MSQTLKERYQNEIVPALKKVAQSEQYHGSAADSKR